MAAKRIRLPALKVTKRPAYGKKALKYLERSIHYDSVPAAGIEGNPPDVSMEETVLVSTSSSTPSLNESTCYQLESKASIDGWASIRKALEVAVVEGEVLPLMQSCHHCQAAATVRCKRCGPRAYFCQECFFNFHRNINIFHVAEVWKTNHFEPLRRTEELSVDIRPLHECATKHDISIQVVDEYGLEHSLRFMTCSCEPLAVTMTRAEIWPASPTNPRFGFAFALLDWAEALLLEAQVSLQDFCNTLKFRHPFENLKGRNIYSSLINAFEEYRFLKHKLRHLDFISDDLDSGNVCPACPKSEGTVVYAMDAVFGLPRKKSAGISHRRPLHDQLFFQDQSAVDSFVAKSDSKSSTNDSCSNFLAGNALRSANRYKALDETAVFGYCCRHEFPGEFINLKHGERLAYSVWILHRIIDKTSPNKFRVFVMYDIACTLSRHLQCLGRSDILDTIHLCLPIFHCYGHKASCQVNFSPRRCDGVGLSDGESMERLWSYLRRFARATKEMRPAHRVDVLSSALIYYGIQKKEKMGTMLLMRLERAVKTRALAEETLNKLIPGTVEVQEATVNQLMLKEKDMCGSSPKPRSKPPMWHGIYFQTLHLYYSVRAQLTSVDSEESPSNSGLLLSSLNRSLSELEKEHSIHQRWLPTDKQYKDCEYAIMMTRREQLLLDMWSAGQRRMFLLELKKKYADGQKIAKRLCAQISKETSRVKSLLAELNACSVVGGTQEMSLVSALNPRLVRSQLNCHSYIPSTLTEEELQAINAYLFLCRSNEEIVLLKKDAENCLEYYTHKKRCIDKSIELMMTVSSQCARGSVSLLYSKLTVVEKFVVQSRSVMDKMASDDFQHVVCDEEEDFFCNEDEATGSESSSDEL